MLDAAADRFQRRRDHVAAVGNGGGAEYDGQFGAGLEHLVERASERRAVVRHAPFGDDRGAGRRQPIGGDLQRLLDDFGGEARQHRGDDADLADAIGRDAQQRLCDAVERRVARVARRPRTE